MLKWAEWSGVTPRLGRMVERRPYTQRTCRYSEVLAITNLNRFEADLCQSQESTQMLRVGAQ